MDSKKSEHFTKKIDNVPNLGQCEDGLGCKALAVIFYAPFRKELNLWSTEIKKDLGFVLTKIQKGQFVGYPDTKAMKVLAAGCFEIRLKGDDGIYRVFYILKNNLGILVFHGFKKKTQKTPANEIKIGKNRLKALLQEFRDEE